MLKYQIELCNVIQWKKTTTTTKTKQTNKQKTSTEFSGGLFDQNGSIDERIYQGEGITVRPL